MAVAGGFSKSAAVLVLLQKWLAQLICSWGGPVAKEMNFGREKLSSSAGVKQ